jgi:hypothetical protein
MLTLTLSTAADPDPEGCFRLLSLNLALILPLSLMLSREATRCLRPR